MPPLKTELIPILKDNYVFLIINTESKTCVVVDPGVCSPVQDILKNQNLKLEAILLTHHHDDHIGGALELADHWNAPIYAPLKNKAQISFATHYLKENESLVLLQGTLNLTVLELPGHTLGHIAYYESSYKWLFSGDVLFGLGCGRLFEGTFEQGYGSLLRIRNLPPETLIYCAHEYTEINLKFCQALTSTESAGLVRHQNDFRTYEHELLKKRSAGLPSVPLLLNTEKKVNPFFLSENVEEFTYLRSTRNRF